MIDTVINLTLAEMLFLGVFIILGALWLSIPEDD